MAGPCSGKPETKAVKLIVGPTCKIPRSTQRSCLGIRRSPKMCHGVYLGASFFFEPPSGHYPRYLFARVRSIFVPWTSLNKYHGN